MDLPVNDLAFVNLWGVEDALTRTALLEYWRENAPALSEERIRQRLDQVVFVVRSGRDGRIVAESTAEKVFIRQLRHRFYNIRTMVAHDTDVSPVLLPKLVTETCSFLESIHRTDGSASAIGIITLIENEGLKEVLRKAVLSASGLVFIGNSPRGHQIRVRYFKDAFIS